MMSEASTPATSIIDSDELALVRSSLRNVLETSSPSGTHDALLATGWAELVDFSPADAITILSEEAGALRSAFAVVDLAFALDAEVEADAATSVIYDGLVLARIENPSRYLMADGDAILQLERDAVLLTPAAGFDPTLGLSIAVVDRAAAIEIGPSVHAVACARRAVASQMVGAVNQMLSETLAYINERHQYGRAIGSFQTVKHRMAEVKVAATAAQAGVRAAWDVTDGPVAATAAIAAKCLAGRAHQLASNHCFQVHGGIAFTVEHGFNKWVRRGLLLDHLLGGHEQLTIELGRRLISSGSTPRVPNLYQSQ
jgi:hypothetical protein